MRKIGLFGLSGNPPHQGHLEMATNLHDVFHCEEVWMLVTPFNPLKGPGEYASLEDRVALCELLAAGYDWLKPTDLEKDLDSTYTVNTLRVLRERYPDYEFIWSMGKDNVHSFDRWQDWKTILAYHPMVLFDRPEYDDISACPAFVYAQQNGLVSDNNDDHNGHLELGFHFCHNIEIATSSTDIRKELLRDRNKCPDGLPQELYQYIISRGLFLPKTEQQLQLQSTNPKAAPQNSLII